MSKERLSRHWLIVDMSSMGHRMFHALPKLTAVEINTQVIYGVFREIVALMDRYRTRDIVFCFDSAASKRRELFPDYKKKRREKEYTEEELLARKEMYAQMKAMRLTYLREIGFANILVQPGYEADDIMASVVASIPDKDSATIITGDHDLLQCIRWNVHFYDPAKQRVITLADFRKTYGFNPEKWAVVKEIGGCRTDGVPGCVPGIAEGIALNYLRGKLKPTAAYRKKIESEAGVKGREFNRKLVKLPFKGTKTFDLVPGCELSEEGWWSVCERLHFSSLLKRGRHNPFHTIMPTIESTRRAYVAEHKLRRAPF